MEGTALWACSGTSDQLLYKDVEDGRLVYDRLSGETRQLSHLSQFLVEWLQAQGRPASTADLVRDVHAEEPESSEHECLAAVQTALAALGEAHVLRQVAP